MANMLMVFVGLNKVKENTAKCCSCGASCEVERVAPGITQANIRHKKTCAAFNMVKAFMESLHGDEDFIPKVENLIDPSLLMEYYEDISRTELEDIEKLTNDMFAAATLEERKKLINKLAVYDNHDVSTPILSRIVEKGLETPQDRVNFKHFLVYLKSHQRSVEDFMEHAFSMECERNEMSHKFDRAFTM